MTLTKNIKIDTSALNIIAGMQWETTPKGVVGRIVGGQLERKLYEAVNKGLDALGGKWNRGMGGHVFGTDPRPQVEALLGTGVVVVEHDGFFRTDRTSRLFQLLLDEYGYSEQLPDDSFKASGTGVATRLVYLRK
jgi:hypothetical protein